MGWYYWFYSSLMDSSDKKTQTSCPVLASMSNQQINTSERSSDWQRQKQPWLGKKKEQPSRLLSYFISPCHRRSKIVAKESVKCRKMGSNLKLFSAQEHPVLRTPHPPARSPLPPPTSTRQMGRSGWQSAWPTNHPAPARPALPLHYSSACREQQPAAVIRQGQIAGRGHDGSVH